MKSCLWLLENQQKCLFKKKQSYKVLYKANVRKIKQEQTTGKQDFRTTSVGRPHDFGSTKSSRLVDSRILGLSKVLVGHQGRGDTVIQEYKVGPVRVEL